MNVDEIVKSMIDLAETSGPATKSALLRGVAAIKHLQGEKMIVEAERLLAVATRK